METIKDILSEMLEVADAENGILAIHAPRLVNRIEKAVKTLEADRDNWRKQALAEDERANATQSVTKCNQLKMREALDKLLGVFNSGLVEYSNWCNKSDIAQIQYVIDKAGEVISAPPRNCDMFNAPDEALSVYCEEKGKTHPLPLWHDNEFWDFIQWLFAKVKGDINGND